MIFFPYYLKLRKINKRKLKLLKLISMVIFLFYYLANYH